MDNVPVRVNDQGPGRRGSNEQESTKKPKVKLKKAHVKRIGMSAIAVGVVALVVLAGLFIYRASTGATIDSTKYQAVFFTNGQVYFGKLQTVNDSYLKLTDIFYLQTKTSDPKNPQQTTDETSGDVELVKLGEEIHGPEDAMVINKDQLLFFENLKTDGKVTQSIVQFNNK